MKQLLNDEMGSLAQSLCKVHNLAVLRAAALISVTEHILRRYRLEVGLDVDGLLRTQREAVGRWLLNHGASAGELKSALGDPRRAGDVAGNLTSLPTV